MLTNEILFEEKKMSLIDVGEWFQNYDHGGMFKRGRKGLIKPQVKAVQQFLTDNGFKYKVKNKAGKIVTGLPKPDGWYGAKTASAVKAFQKKDGLKPDGDVGRNTLKAMINFGSDELDPSPPSAELTTGADAKFKKKEYEPVDYGNITAYMANAFAKWYKGEDPRSAFQIRPDMPKSLKNILQSTVDSQQMDTKKKRAVGKQIIYADHKTVDGYLYHVKRYGDNPPGWVKTIAAALKDAVDYSRLDPKKTAEVRDALNAMKVSDKKPAQQAQTAAQPSQSDLLGKDVEDAEKEIKDLENRRKRLGLKRTDKMSAYLSTFIHSKDNEEKYEAFMGYKKASNEMVRQQQFGN